MKHELYKTKEDIENWLNEYKITNYEIIKDNKYGYVVNVNESINLRGKNLNYIPIKFNIIDGDLHVGYNELKDLSFSPIEINGFFNANNNQLKHIKDICKNIKGSIILTSNKLKSLKGCQKIINGNFFCNHNELKNLKYCPEYIDNEFNFNFNPLSSLIYFPKDIGDKIHVINGIEILYGKGEIDGLGSIISKDELFQKHKEDINKILMKKLHKAIISNTSIKNKKKI